MKKYYLCLLLISLWHMPAMAQLRVDITSGDFQPLPIAFLPFETMANDGEPDPEIDRLAKNLVGVIHSNLSQSGLFKGVPRKDFVEESIAFDEFPDFGAWRLINTQAILIGKIEKKDSKNKKKEFVHISFRLWDVFAQKQIAAFNYKIRFSGWRRVAHKISDHVYQRITGEEGYFDTRIIYVAESGPLTNRSKQLAIMDQDGYNNHIISKDEGLILTPRFSPSRQEILYMRLHPQSARVYWLDLISGKQFSLGDFEGMYYAPRFTPSGNGVVYSYAQDGNSDIWYMDLRTRERRRLTRHSAIDTSPSPSPDGKFVAFTSNRGGKPQIYVMRNNGGNVKRITYGQGYFSTPVWSPRGDYIAFTRQAGGQFAIGVIRPDGKNMRILFKDFHVEAPTWSPNGRVLMFFKNEKSNKDGTGGRTRIYSIDVTGYNLREVPTPTDASDPAWSPLIF